MYHRSSPHRKSFDKVTNEIITFDSSFSSSFFTQKTYRSQQQNNNCGKALLSQTRALSLSLGLYPDFASNKKQHALYTLFSFIFPPPFFKIEGGKAKALQVLQIRIHLHSIYHCNVIHPFLYIIILSSFFNFAAGSAILATL